MGTNETIDIELINVLIIRVIIQFLNQNTPQFIIIIRFRINSLTFRLFRNFALIYL